jgi:uncharacterized RDD family membrane protein YckC
MSTADDYVNSVIGKLPRTVPRREQIGTELRSHIAERIAAGNPMDDVLRQLGDPGTLAESYLAEVPLVPAPHLRRVAAKLVDVLVWALTVAVLLAPGIGAASAQERLEFIPMAIGLAVIVGSLLFAAYTVVAEWRFGATVGKHLLSLRVVRESGARIGLGQSIVRQLPAPLQVFAIDALFILFTDKKQRAFEMLSKTRTVLAEE